MSNYKYAIKKLPIKSWIKYWLWRNRTGGTKYKFALSEIKEGSNFYLENTIKRKFNMFELFGKTTQDGTPTPENPIPIVNLTGNINEKIQNANLVDIEKLLNQLADNVVKNADGSYTFTPKSSSYNTGYSIKIPVPSKYSYKIKNGTGANFRLRFVYEDEYIADGVGSGTGADETTITNNPLTTHGNVVEIRFNWTTIGTFTIRDFMFNKGTTALPYIPHAEQNISFPLEEGQIFAEGDYLADDGIHHVRGHSVLDGTKGGYNTDYNWFYLSKSNFVNNVISFDLLSNYFIKQNYADFERDSTLNGICWNSSNLNTVTHLLIRNTECTNVTEYKAWLAELYANNVPVELEYPLAEEVVEPFTEEQQTAYNQIKELYTYNEITNIDGDANLKIKYWERVER